MPVGKVFRVADRLAKSEALAEEEKTTGKLVATH